MKIYCTYACRLVGVIFISLLYLKGNTQVIPSNETYGGYTSNVPLAIRLVSLSPNPALPLSYAYVSPATIPGTDFMYLGLTPGSNFRPGNRAFYFNYTTGGAVPGAGQTGGGDYRILFAKDTDTTQKKGNFAMSSLYLAIGTGNTSDVKIQGFRAGKLVAEATIPGLSTSDGTLNSVSGTDLNYSTSDAYAGVTVSFGTNWKFLDGIRFVIPSANTPLAVDDLQFASPDDVAPGTQVSATGFTNSTGISSQVNWTGGSGDSVAVFMAATNSGSASPAAHTFYKSNTTFGSGDEAGTGWFCVYRGADVASSSTNVYGLTPGTTYRTMVVSYNGAFQWEDYHTTVSTNINNFTTIAVPSTQASGVSVVPNVTDFKRALINFTRGNGAKTAVFVRNNTTTTDATVAPLNNNNNADAAHHTYSAFTDSVNVTANGRVGTSEWYCVFNGNGSGTGLPAAVSMSRITARPGQTLRVMVVEYNGTAGAETYNLSSATSNVIDYFNPNFPLPVTNASTGVTTTAATFNGSIDPRGGNITGATYVYSTNSLLSSVLGTVTTLSPAATSIVGAASPTAVSAAITGLSPSTTYYYRLSAVSNAGALTATNNTGGANNGIMSFTTAPVISSVSATTANGSYKAGDVVIITVGFTSAVTVTGTPTIALNTGAVVNYTSGSRTNTLSFNYTIAGTQTTGDLDYTSTTALVLGGATIRDAGGNDALLTLPTVAGPASLGGQKNIIIDTQIPALSNVTILSDNTNTSLAKAGNVITLSFTASETIVSPMVSIAGNLASVTNTGNNWMASYTMATSDVNGTIPFSISFRDIALNAGVEVNTTTNNSSVTFDKTLPILSTVTIASNNSNTSYAKTGDVITLNFTASEAIGTPNVTIAGNAATVTGAGNSFTATYTITSSNTTGIIPFNISFSDMASNAGLEVNATTNSSTVTFDKTIPSLSTVSISSSNANNTLAKAGDIVKIVFTSTEKIATPTVTIAGHPVTNTNTSNNDWSATYTMTTNDAPGTVTMSISNIIDVAGNAGVTVTGPTTNVPVVFDNIAPTLTAVSIASNNTNTALAKPGNLVSIVFVASEAITTPTVIVAGNAAVVTNTSANNWTASYTMKESDPAGIIAFTIAFADLAGNSGVSAASSTNSSTVVFDKTITVTPVVLPAYSFTGGNAIAFTICQDVNDRNISSLLSITGATTGAAFSWTASSFPAHGTLSGFATTATATSTTVTPSGLIYKPTAGYNGNDVFIVSVASGSSTITTTISITVNALPAVVASSPQGTILCGALMLQATGGSSYTWSNNGVAIAGVTTGQLAINTPGTYTVIATNANGCTAAAANNVTVTQLQKPIVAFIFDSYCTNKAITFTTQSTTTNSGPVTYAWSDGTNASTIVSPAFTYTQPGTYNMKLTVTPTGCAAMAESITKAVAVESPTVAIRMPSLNIAANSSITVQARTFGNTYTWTPATGLSNATISAPLVNITTEQEYRISIGTASGCVTVDTLLLRTFTTASILLPNVFSPNGDGVNDYLLPNLVDVRTFQYFRVFNRAGKKIFDSNDPTKGWDGKVNGEKQPNGTYLWSAAGLDKNGNIVHKEGSVTLLR